MYQVSGHALCQVMHTMTGTDATPLTAEQYLAREHLNRVRSAARVTARCARARLAADLIRLERWAQGGEVWTSTSERPA